MKKNQFSVNDYIEKVCAILKIKMVNTIPGRPQGKGKVERFFLTLMQNLLERLPGYQPQGAPKAKAILSLEEFAVHLKTFILDEYHKTSHSVTKQLPIERWTGEGFLLKLPPKFGH